jgi:7,8-dihydro-6-hydroxymethylpterin-pyrophosphokinase
MGDRVAMIEKACKEMEATGKIKLVRTSSLWDTKAMYVEDQDNFVNGVCEVGLPTSTHAYGFSSRAAGYDPLASNGTAR